MALINQNSIIGVTSITSPSASNVLTVHTNDTTERLRVSTSGVSFSGTNASLDTSGNISAVDGTFTGNVSVGGTLTYEDVTNIDSVGIITAQSDVHVGAGLSVVGITSIGHAEVTTAQFTGSYVNVDGNLDIADSIRHLGDSNTKIRFPANDTISFETGGSERVHVTSAGNIGIGTDTPYTNNSFNSLSIGGSGKYGLIELVKSNGIAGSWIDAYGTNGDGNLRFTTAGTSGAITFWTGGSFTEKVRITSAGDVGIGTTNPGSKLAVHGSITESTDGVTYYPVVTQQDVGLDQNQIPLNQNLGGMAYMDTSNYEQVFEIPATDVTSYFKANNTDIWIGMEGHAPSSVAWPSGSLNQIDVWEIDFQLTYPNMTSGRNDLWMLLYYHNGSSITIENSVEWNNWVLARNSYAGTNTGWNQIQSATGTNWGKIANYMDAKLFSGKILFYRGGTNDFTGSNAGQRTGVMWQFNYTHGGIGSTLAFGSAHPTTPSPSQPLAGFVLNADPENAGTVDSNGNSQVFGGYIRQRGFRLQGNI